MADKETLQLEALLQEISLEQPDFTYDEAAITSEVAHSTSLLKRWPVKLLTILGGMLALSTLLGFLMAAGLYNSGIGMLIFGLGFLGGAEVLMRIEKTFTAEAIGVSLNIAGYVLLAIGTGILSENTTAVALILGIASTLVLVFSRSSLFVFISVLVLNGSLLSLIFIHKVYNLSHALIMVLAGILTLMSLYEAKLLALSRRFALVFGPVRMGVVFSLINTLVLFVHQKLLSTNITHFWLSGLFLIGCLLLLLHRVLRESGVKDQKTLAIFYTCCAVVLLPTVLAPSVPGALLVVLSSFYIGHRTGFWVGLLALAYFLVLYYYDLNMTLLAKSGVLVLTGSLFLAGLYLLNRYLRNHEA
ncbi:DUF4401 domain-containing protein [Pontibacter sp. HSC-14F20]|uniref:DUF4401 domain-containing protein n=1 Tax=Pontibacter sp. HSC-14F20 TaxID=2864136 RepID=UPI001C73BC0B|nr:DUF4401 domain-containing protein [Pontibacter sp. HSC-14F20]MBX0333952.1 DUF4401 domain-containing protein [Pontibacter sp. HSC-14F20]